MQYLALQPYVPHYTCSLQVLVQNDALKPHLILVIALLRIVNTFISSDQVEQDHAKVISDVLMLLVSHDLEEARELNLLLLDQLRQIPHELLEFLLLNDVLSSEEDVGLIVQALLQLLLHLVVAALLGLPEHDDFDLLLGGRHHVLDVVIVHLRSE